MSFFRSSGIVVRNIGFQLFNRKQPGRSILPPNVQRLPQDWIFFPPKEKLKSDPVTGWTTQTKRCGVLGQKIGMIMLFDPWSVPTICTMIKLENCQVTQAKTPQKEGFFALQIGAGIIHPKRVNKPTTGHCEKAGVEPKRKFMEFQVSPDAMLPVGTRISGRHFVPGQYLVLKGHTKGKGFQGGMKRHGFHGLPASHGVSLTHRSIGSTGNRKSPGRVFKGKKMPGQMGGPTRPRISVTCLLYKIDVKNDILYVRGSVPGPKGSWLRIRDSDRKEWPKVPPMPTFFPPPNERAPTELVMDVPKPDISGEDESLEDILKYFETGILKEENVLTDEFIIKERLKTAEEEYQIMQTHIITMNEEVGVEMKRLSTEHLVSLKKSDLHIAPVVGVQMGAEEELGPFFNKEHEAMREEAKARWEQTQSERGTSQASSPSKADSDQPKK